MNMHLRAMVFLNFVVMCCRCVKIWKRPLRVLES